MKIVITGHTRGIGKAFYDHFVNLGHEVVGVSRSTGFDIPNDINRIVELATNCDLFVNNIREMSTAETDKAYRYSMMIFSIFHSF